MANESTIKQKGDSLEGIAVYLKDNPTAPARILVSTATHLVPGDGYSGKTKFIQNLVSQHHWNCDYDRIINRFEEYNAQFGFDNRTCYFLIDHSQSLNAEDKDIPILRYRWTGKSLNLIREPLPSIIRKKLKRFPFTPFKSLPKRERRELTSNERRKDIRALLHCEMGLRMKDFEFLKEPEHALWLEQNIEPKFWSKYKSLEAERRSFGPFTITKQERTSTDEAAGWSKMIRQEQTSTDKAEGRGFKPLKINKQEQTSTECTGMWDCEYILCDLRNIT